MKRTIPVILIIVTLNLLACAGADAQTNPASLSHALNQDKQPRAEQQQQRRVNGRTLTSDALPPIKIKFDKAFKYVGTQSFVLYERAQVEQFFFVAADKGRIKRMFLVQFEGYLPNNAHTYEYNIKNTIKLGGLDFISDNAAVNVPAFRKQHPDSDAARGAAFLEAKGYVLAGDDIMFQRFVRLVDEARRNELLIIYYETLGGTNFTAANLYDKGSAEQREKLFEELRKRALKGFTIDRR